jgi:hypothetical protein
MALVRFLVATAVWIALSVPAGLSALDRGADGNFDQRRSMHFRLLQDVDIDRATGRLGTRAFERAVLQELELAYEKVRRTLDLRPRQDVNVVIYDPQVFEDSFAHRFKFSAVGFYDGNSRLIHVRGNTRVDQALVRTLHHEYFHAVLDAVTTSSRVPAWLNEGLSQWFENLAVGKKSLSQAEFNQLHQANRGNTWLPLQSLSGPTLANLGAENARTAYLQSYAMVDYLMKTHGAWRMRSFMRQITRGGNLERLMRREFRVDLEGLEREVRAQFD